MVGTHLRTSFSYIRRAPFQALAAISVLALTFFIATLLGLLTYGSNQLVSYFETRPQVIAFLKKDTSPQAQEDLQKKLAGDGRVKEVKVVSKEEALDIYKKGTTDNPLLGELVSPTGFPASVEFSVVDLKFAQEIIDEVRREPIVQSVGFTANLGGESTLGQVVERLKTITFYVRVAGLVIVLILGLTSFLVLMVVISMRIIARRDELATLRLIGATGGFIRSPILFEALNYAFIGVFAGWFFGVVVILYSTPAILTYFEGISVLPGEAVQFFLLLGGILGVEMVVGALLSVIGAEISVSRALTRK